VQVKAIRNFDLELMMGHWYVVQYYSSTEESAEYSCMRNVFTFSNEDFQVSISQNMHINLNILTFSKQFFHPIHFLVYLCLCHLTNDNLNVENRFQNSVKRNQLSFNL